MTRNQLDYWKNQETERHNKVLEAQGLESLVIQRRANEISAQSVAETTRSNRARELETYRSNLAREANEALRTIELTKSNAEIARSNRANEAIGWANVGVRKTEADINRQNANTRYSELLEQTRHNKAVEEYSKNSNPWQSIATTITDAVEAMNARGGLPQLVTTVKDWYTNSIQQARQAEIERRDAVLKTAAKAESLYRSGIVTPNKSAKTTASKGTAKPIYKKGTQR